MLREEVPIIGTGEGNDGLKTGNIIVVRKGSQTLALCKVIGENFEDYRLTEKYYHENFRKVQILEWYKGDESFPQPQKTLERLINPATNSWKYINNFYQHYLNSKKMHDNVELLL